MPKKPKKNLVCPSDPRKVLEHFDHLGQLEIVTYGKPGERPVSVVVECTRCGCVVQELYDVGWEKD